MFMRKIIFSRPDHYVKTKTGTKTETRRIHGLKALAGYQLIRITDKQFTNKKLRIAFHVVNGISSKEIVIDSHYKIDEQLFVAEPTFVDAKKGEIITPFTKVFYPFDFKNTIAIKKKWKEKGLRFVSSLFMKRCQAREFIKITDIDCHQIQDISRSSIIKEGYNDDGCEDKGMRVWFALVFDSINGTGTYLKNPFVFSYTYKRVNRKGEELL